MGVKYNPKSKGSPTSWKALQRKLPRTLSTFQIMILAGFLSLLLMRSTIGLGSMNFTSRYTTAADDEYANEEQSRLTDNENVEPKRNLVQTAGFDLVDKLQKPVQKNVDVEFEDEMDRHIGAQHLDEVRAATSENPKNVKEEQPVKVVEAAAKKKPDTTNAVNDHVKNVEEEQPRKAVEKEKLVVAKSKEEVVEDFEQVEAQLGEEETPDELAEFEKFQKGEKEGMVSSAKQPTKTVEQIKLPTVDPKPKKEKSVVEKKATEKESSAEKKAEKVISIEEPKPAEKKKSEEDESVDGRVADDGTKHDEEHVEEALAEEKGEGSEPEMPRKLTPEEVKAFTAEAIANMSIATRRDDQNAFTLGPKISDWDEQRAAWLEKNPDMKSSDPHKPKVLLLSGSQPWPCSSPVGDHYLLKMIKNKVDYARIHKLETFYSFAHLDKPMSHYWAKLPLIRKMMLMRPEMEWLFWMDSDALFTDMVFEIPFEKYQDYNLVMWGYPEGIYDERSWVACNTGVMFLRNNQWTLDLLEIWSHMGPEGAIRNEAGSIMSSYLTSRPEMQADDQSALVFLMLTMPELRPKIALEDDYYLSGYWVPLVGRYEEFSEKSRPGAGGWNWPFTTHFTGCQPCSGLSNELYEGNTCLDGMERAFNFADNQVLRPFGFEHETLQGSKVLRIRNETTKPIWSVPAHNPWAVDSFYS